LHVVHPRRQGAEGRLIRATRRAGRQVYVTPHRRQALWARIPGTPHCVCIRGLWPPPSKVRIERRKIGVERLRAQPSSDREEGYFHTDPCAAAAKGQHSPLLHAEDQELLEAASNLAAADRLRAGSEPAFRRVFCRAARFQANHALSVTRRTSSDSKGPPIRRSKAPRLSTSAQRRSSTSREHTTRLGRTATVSNSASRSFQSPSGRLRSQITTGISPRLLQMIFSPSLAVQALCNSHREPQKMPGSES